MILDEVLEEARAEVSRNWVSWEDRYTGGGEARTLDPKMASPFREDPLPAYSAVTGRPMSVIGQLPIPKGRPTTRKLKISRGMEECEKAGRASLGIERAQCGEREAGEVPALRAQPE